MTALVIFTAHTVALAWLVSRLVSLAALTWRESDIIAVPIYWEGEAARAILTGELVLARWQFVETTPHTMRQPEGVH